MRNQGIVNRLAPWALLFLACCPLASLGQSANFVFVGKRIEYTIAPGTYSITAYGAKGGFSTILNHEGGLGAEISAVFRFAEPTALTIVVGGAGNDGPGSPRGPGGGGGGSYVVAGTKPLVVAGGGGGGGYDNTVGVGSPGLITNGGAGGLGGLGNGGAGGGGFTTDGGPGFWGSGQGYSFLNGGSTKGGGFYGASGGGFGGGGGGGNYQGGGGGGYTGGNGGAGNAGGNGGGSYVDASAVSIRLLRSGVASPDGSHNGQVIIESVVPPTIELQPVSRVVDWGATVEFSVKAASQESISYQWRLAGDSIPGATNSVYSIASVTPQHTGLYDVIVTTGSGSVNSATASLGVFAIARVPVLVLSGPQGASYQIQSTTNLTAASSWNAVTNIVLSVEKEFIYYVDYSTYRTTLPTYYRAIPK